MSRPKLFVVLSLLCFVLPLVLAVGVALLWLEEAGWLIPGLLLFAGLYICGWKFLSLATRRQRVSVTQLGGEIAPEEFWGDGEFQCWEKVIACSRSVELGDQRIDDLRAIQEIFLSLVTEIATASFPLSSQPLLEVKAEDLLLVIEQAAEELRVHYVSQIPLHNLLTLNEIVRAKRGWQNVQKLFDAYRAVRPVTNPVSAVIHEIRALLARGAITRVSDNTTRWFQARMIELVGKQLINLYRGSVVDRSKIEGYKDDAPLFDVSETAITIAVIGEVNAGKSSVINALFGETVTPAYHLPETEGEIRLEKEIEGIGKVIIVDTKGYGDSGSTHGLEKLLKRSDAVLLITPANAAARMNDLRIVQLLQSMPSRERPPLLVALTKIDLLRPKKSWNPPYELVELSMNSTDENRLKAGNIKEALMQVAYELQVSSSLIVPVYAKRVNESYNIDLLGVMLHDLLPEARRMVLRRLLAHYRDEQYWAELKQSIAKGGRMLIGLGAKGAARALGHLG